MKYRLAFMAVSAALASTAFAAPQDLPVYRTGGAGSMIVGSGIPKNNFTVSTDASGVSVALKARNRDTGQALSISGTTYYVSPGLSTVQSPGQPQLSFDFQVSPGASGLAATDLWLQLEVDFDPGVGTNFATIAAPSNLGGDGYFTNGNCGNGLAPVACTWSGADPYVVSQSSQLGFAFWSAVLGGPTNYNPNNAGVYDLRLSAYRGQPSSTSLLASVSIQAVVLPEPSTVALIGIAALGLGLIRRRKTGV